MSTGTAADRVVLDSCVLIAAAGNTSIAHRILLHEIERGTLFVSEYILDEVQRNLQRKPFNIAKAVADEYIAEIRSNATVVDPVAVPPAACGDPKDLPILGTAVAAKAACLVSADSHLTDLGSYRGIPILKTGQYYRKISGL